MSIIIVFGNEKGGSGKTTTIMNIMVALLKKGFTVASVDIDSYQHSLSSYIQKRQHLIDSGLNILTSRHFRLIDGLGKKYLNPKEIDNKTYSQLIIPFDSEIGFIEEKIAHTIDTLSKDYQFILFDTPGSHTEISKTVHSFADIVATPINDSFLDFELLGKINPNDSNAITPGPYSAMLFDQRAKKAERSQKKIDWVVITHRLFEIDTRNQKNIDLAVHRLSKRLSFRMADGFGRREIYRASFDQGVTVLDDNVPLIKSQRGRPSIMAAITEVYMLMKDLLSNIEI